jgi:hypothetical protein
MREDGKRPIVAVLGAVVIMLIAVGGLHYLSTLSTRTGAASRAVAAGRATPSKGAGPEPAGVVPAGSVALLVARDFGSRTLLDLRSPLSAASTVLDLVSRNATVETAYGGGFVSSIAGLASSGAGNGAAGGDWFYYVNGIQGTYGSGQYRLAGSERVLWDFHRWDFARSVPAIVGQFPEPFVRGYEDKALPTSIAYAPGSGGLAHAVANRLRVARARHVTTAPMTPGLAPPRGRHLILVGTWPDLASLAWVRDSADNPASSGLFARFGREAVQALDGNGRVAMTEPAAGAVMATARGDEPAAAIWLVTGSDTAAVSAAAGLLTDRPAALAGKFGVLVDRAGGVTALPIPEHGR